MPCQSGTVYTYCTQSGKRRCPIRWPFIRSPPNSTNVRSYTFITKTMRSRYCEGDPYIPHLKLYIPLKNSSLFHSLGVCGRGALHLRWLRITWSLFPDLLRRFVASAINSSIRLLLLPPPPPRPRSPRHLSGPYSTLPLISV